MFIKYYDYLLSVADKRVDGWFLMDSPIPVLTIAAFYLFLVYIFLPSFMKNRKPYDISQIIKYYNILQIVYCIYLIYGVATSGWTTHYKILSCQPIDYSLNPMALRMLKFVYHTFFLKMIELVETIFFLLRKKTNQVTNLHVYHHTSTFILAWLGAKYLGGGMATFPILLNSFIHVLMYIYYYLSALGPSWQKKLVKWKPRLTMAQMIQFCILIAHSLTVLAPDCKQNATPLLIYIPNVVVIFYMFYQFYKDNYSKKLQ